MDTILHFIPSLEIGGAEKLLEATTRELSEYDHVVVVFKRHNKEVNVRAKVISLDEDIPIGAFSTIRKLNRILRLHRPKIVHSHLYWPVIISRLLTTSNSLCFQWYHNDIYHPHNKAQYSFKRLLLDRITYSKKFNLVFVSESIKQTISSKIGARSNTFALHNFVHDVFFECTPDLGTSQNLNILLVANLRHQKNQIVFIKALALLENNSINATIIGEGPMRDVLEAEIKKLNLKNVRLIGTQSNVAGYMHKANIFVMPSLHEGFGISLAEAMAAGLPCIVSSIDVLNEVGEDTVMYFDPYSPDDLALKIKEMQNPLVRQSFSAKSKKRASIFSKKHYFENIRKLYSRKIG